MRGFRVWGFRLSERGDQKRAKEPSPELPSDVY